MNSEQQIIKEKAVSFLKLVAKGEVREAYTSYIGSGFCHHNPYFPGDQESLMKAMEEEAARNPQKILDVKSAIVEGNMVMVYSNIKQSQEDLGWAVVHIFRFEQDKIVEMWDVGQSVPENSPNENGVF